MRQSGRVLAERIIREHRAGKYDIDIVGTSAVTFAAMKDSGVIAPYVSPEATLLRQNMKDPTGWWVAYFGNIQAIICNKTPVKSPPNDWKDFLDPKWKGEFSIDDTRYEWFYALQNIYGREEANKMISGFRQNGVNLRGKFCHHVDDRNYDHWLRHRVSNGRVLFQQIADVVQIDP